MRNSKTYCALPTSLKLDVEWAQDMYDDFFCEKSPDKRRQIFLENGVPSKLVPAAIELFS